MANFTIDADGFGSFYENVGFNGTDDTVTVNIGTGFSGSITVDSQPSDGEIDDTIINLPAGWELKIVNLVEINDETPSYKDFSYQVLDGNGESRGTLSIRSNNIQGAPCFASGTEILTPSGYRIIETLAEGDLVMTRDHGARPLRWIGMSRVNARRLSMMPQLRPIRIRAGALGDGLPATDLVVSPQHRVLVRSKIALKMFGALEVLVAAKQLLTLDGFDILEDVDAVDYYHLLFDRHEIVFSNGAETEALYTGPEALRMVGSAAREEILTLFPQLANEDYIPEAARMLPSGRMGRKLATRHLQNKHSLVM